jgi:thymidine kinase
MAKLRFYYSAMNAGKSTALLQAAFNYQERGMRTLLFTPTVDTRAQLGLIASRIGLEAQACPFSGDFDFFQHVEGQLNAPDHGIKCMLVDEAQFLTKAQVKQLTNIVDDLGLPVLAYGLRSDFRGEPFEGSQYLLIWAEDLIEIKTVCHCGSKATMNLRIDENGQAVWNGEQVEIGGNDRYVSLCRRHFWEGKAH